MLSAALLAFSVWGFIKGLMMFTFIVTAFLMTVVILLQEPKGGGLASAFGGAGAETFGVKSGGVNKFTGTLATIFMALAILYAAIRPPEALAPSAIGSSAGSTVESGDDQPWPPDEPPAEEPETPPAEQDSPAEDGSDG